MTHSLDNQLSNCCLSITESCTVECGALFGGTYKNIKDERGHGRGRASDGINREWHRIHGGVEKIHGFEREGHIAGR